MSLHRRDFIKGTLVGLYGGRVLAAVEVPIAKRPIDGVVLSHLKRHGGEPKYVKCLGYDKKFPKSVFYQDQLTGQMTMTTGMLPHVDKQGSVLKPRIERGRDWNIDGNSIDGEITDGGRIATPNGVWSPRLYVGGTELIARGPVLVDDIIAPQKWKKNCLVWEYGACRRIIRTINGRLIGLWRFDENPQADVNIVYDTTNRLKFGRYRKDSRTESVTKRDFNAVRKWPFFVGDQDISYTEEAGTMDATVQIAGQADNWGQLVAETTATAYSDSAASGYLWIVTAGNNPKWDGHGWMILIYDTSGVGSGSTVTAADVDVWITAQVSTLGAANGVLITCSPASQTAVAAGDLDCFNTTAYSSTIAAGGASTGQYNTFSVTTPASVIVVDGNTDFGVITEEIRSAVAPSYTANTEDSMTCDMAEGTNDPRCTVTFTAPGGGFASISGGAATKINGFVPVSISGGVP